MTGHVMGIHSASGMSLACLYSVQCVSVLAATTATITNY